VGRKQPINADVPAEEASGKVKPAPPRAAKAAGGRVPGALKGIAALVLVAVVLIVAAILGGQGNEKSGSIDVATQTAAQLGYPSFATNNTTRVGGADPASNAAAVALAVYPSAAPVQRPDAVALIDDRRWQDAVAAAVLMAAPVRAPLLVSGSGGAAEATRQALDALDPQGSRQTRGAQAFVVGAAEAPSDLQTTEVGGKGATGLAAAIAELRDELFGSKPAHIVIAPVADPGFAVPAAAWAARSGDPVLFTERKELPARTVKALKRYPDASVYVLGPSAAIASQVVREIAKLGNQVRRVSGEDPATNAIALARYADDGFGWNINDPGHGLVLARADSPLDAAVAAPLSASGTWGPLLLTDSAATLPAPLRDYLLDIKPGYSDDPTRAFYNHVWLIGDEEAIDVNQQAEVDELAEVTAVGGEP
jgi:hypothetical protein